MRRCGCCLTYYACYAASPPIPACRAAFGSASGLLLAYLAIPIDLIPGFVPVLGYADDAIIVTLALRSTVRCAGLEAVRAHWPGSDDGFAALCRLTGLPGGNHPADAGDNPRSTESAT